MRVLMNILSGITGIYMLLIFVRIILTWFSQGSYGRPYEVLCSITDPYLNWFRRFPLRFGYLDFSPILAMAVLSLVSNIFTTLGFYGHISIGIILAMILSAVWSAAAFLLSFFIVVLIIRLIAFLTNRNMYAGFWRIIEALSEPVISRICRFLFRNRITNYMTGTIVSIVCLLILRFGGAVLIGLVTGFLARSPI